MLEKIKVKIEEKIEQEEELLEKIKDSYWHNEDGSINHFYVHEIGRLEGIIDGLTIALGIMGYKQKYVLMKEKEEKKDVEIL